MSRIDQAEKPYRRKDLPEIGIGDSVEVDLKIKEGDKERIQTFSGTVIAIRGGGLARTFTVRRIVQGEGVERILPWHSPLIDALRVTRQGKVRRAKLYYLRKRVGKATRLTEILGGREAGDAAQAADNGAESAAGAPATASEARAEAKSAAAKKAEAAPPRT
jgi:large subunit ribosomal protein L19